MEWLVKLHGSEGCGDIAEMLKSITAKPSNVPERSMSRRITVMHQNSKGKMEGTAIEDALLASK